MIKTYCLLLLSLGLISTSLTAQDTTYYSYEHIMISDSLLKTGEDWMFMLIRTDENPFDDQYEFKKYEKQKDQTHILVGDYTTTNDKSEKLNGKYKTWYRNGEVKSIATYELGHLQDTLTTFYDNGTLKRLDVYEKGKLTQGKVYDQEGNEMDYCPYEEQPEFPGGVNEFARYLQKNITYPKKALRRNITGKVYVKFIVKEDGLMSNTKVIKGAHPLLDEEALRVLKSVPRWKPGYQDCEAVSVWYTVPINFQTGR